MECKTEVLHTELVNQMDSLTLLELRAKENMLRLRSFPEAFSENIREKVVEAPIKCTD